MGLFNRGQSISGMWLDGKPAIRAYLGDVLVWDGTKPAFVNVPRALASASAVAPAVRADASISAIPALGSSSAIAPSLTAFATVDPETAVIVTAQASTPAVRADSIIMVETITVGAQALPAVAAQSSAATVAAPAAVVSVVTSTPSMAAHFATTIPAIAVNAAAQVPVITATGAAVVNVPVSAVNAMARVPAVSGNSSVGAFVVTSDATAKTPVVTATSNVSPPKATATGLARVPVVQAINFTPSGMTKNGSQTIPTNTLTQVTGWTPDAGSTVTSDALVVNGSKTDAHFEGAVLFGSNVNRQYTAEVRRGAEVLFTTTVTGGAGGTMTITIPPTLISVTGTDQLTLWAKYSFSTQTVIAGTFLKVY